MPSSPRNEPLDRQPNERRRLDLLWIAVSLLALLPCLTYPYRSLVPQLPFELGPDWQVLVVTPCAAGTPCLEVGDRVLAIDEVSYGDYTRDRFAEPFRGLQDRGHGQLRVLRRGELVTVAVEALPVLPSLLRVEALIALVPFVFWLAGTTAIIFLRPRDERWIVLVLFFYVTAIWFASGLASWRQASASVVFHLFIWLFLPLAVHLHLILPNALLGRSRWGVLTPLYVVSLALALLDRNQRLGAAQQLFALSFMAGVVLSVGLLVARLFRPAAPALRVPTRIMLFGVAFGFGPMILFFLLPLLAPQLFLRSPQLGPWMIGISVLTIPILPLSYLRAIFRHHLGALEFRANRLLGVYGVVALYITCYVAALLVGGALWGGTEGPWLAAGLALLLLFVAVAPAVHGRFQKRIDRHVFGIRHSPDEVIRMVAAAIPTAFNRDVLSREIVEEVLPTLLIRQSALYLFGQDGTETLYEQGLPEDQPAPSQRQLGEWLERAGRYIPPDAPIAGCPWLRLVVPLGIQARIIGVWLFGRRDPDDFYPQSDLTLLATVAHQVAPALENIRLHERARQEIAQRRAVEEEIRASEERYRNLFEATLEGIAVVRHGAILEVNQALLGILGYSAPELIGQPLSSFVSTGAEELGVDATEGIGLLRDGTSANLEVAAKKYVLQGEDVTVVAIRDIERRKRDEEENRQLQRQLLHSQKMEAIGRLSTGVAHDFNNCLLAIFGFSDDLLDHYRDDDSLARGLAGIREAGEKAANLTKKLLAFTRQQPMEERVMSLNAVVAGIEEMVHRILGDGVELVIRAAPDLPAVRIDPSQIEQVILNLVVNARDAMPGGGRLTLETDLVELPGGATPHPDLAAGPFVRLRVTDTGLGMDARTQARVFEPFFSTKELDEGTGLGLSTAYGIIQQSGGHITVASAPGQGTTFTIYLPAAPSGADTVGAEANQPSAGT